MSSSTASPSIWWNWGVWVASESGRYTRPGMTTYSGGGWASIARTCIGEVCVRSDQLLRRAVALDVEGVRARPRRVGRAVVQRVEVVVDGLDLRALQDGEAEARGRCLRARAACAVSRCRRPTGCGGAPGSVTSIAVGGQPRVELAADELPRARVDQRLERLARLVGGRADGAALLGLQLCDVAQQLRQLGLAPQVADAQLSERLAVAAPRDRPLGLRAELSIRSIMTPGPYDVRPPGGSSRRAPPLPPSPRSATPRRSGSARAARTRPDVRRAGRRARRRRAASPRPQPAPARTSRERRRRERDPLAGELGGDAGAAPARRRRRRPCSRAPPSANAGPRSPARGRPSRRRTRAPSAAPYRRCRGRAPRAGRRTAGPPAGAQRCS